MKITAIETIRIEEHPNVLWVHVHTDQGLTGLGEIFYGVPSAEAHIHGFAAPLLLGADPLRIDLHAKNLVGYIGFAGSGAEVRGNSGLDIALWDLWGQATDQPIHQLLGGAVRERIRVYNTCAGYGYVRKQAKWSTETFSLPGAAAEGPYEDLQAFLTDAGALALSLLDMGITGMKIWPFDYAAEASGGTYISAADLDKALEPFARIRDAVGNRIDIMVELHSLWDLTAAKRIARAVEPFDPFWFEDPIKMTDMRALKAFADSTPVPVTASETLGMRGQFRELLESRAAGIIMYDLGWMGGLSEARKIAAMAEAFQVPVAPHDCTGPVLLTASVHHALNAANALVQEIVRAFYYGWYQDMVTALPPIEDGHIRAPDGPGLGLRLQPDVLKRADCHLTRSAL